MALPDRVVLGFVGKPRPGPRKRRTWSCASPGFPGRGADLESIGTAYRVIRTLRPLSLTAAREAPAPSLWALRRTQPVGRPAFTIDPPRQRQ